MKSGDWFLTNSLIASNQRTHIDLSGGKERALDYIATNSRDIISKVVCDNSLEATPYQVMMRGKRVIGRKFTDHKTQMMKMQLAITFAEHLGRPSDRCFLGCRSNGFADRL